MSENQQERSGGCGCGGCGCGGKGKKSGRAGQPVDGDGRTNLGLKAAE